MTGAGVAQMVRYLETVVRICTHKIRLKGKLYLTNSLLKKRISSQDQSVPWPCSN